MEAAEIDRKDVYLTNAVKHFKWRARGKRRFTRLLAPVAALTSHPSAILRLKGHDEREDAFAGLVDDLRLVVGAMGSR